MRLVPAEVVLGTHIDDAEDNGGLRPRNAEGQRAGSQRCSACLEQCATRKIDEGHGVSSPVCTQWTSMQSMCQCRAALNLRDLRESALVRPAEWMLKYSTVPT